MDAPVLERVQTLFHGALDQEPHSRVEFLRQACGEDLQLLTEVQALLDAHECASEFLANPTISPNASPSAPHDHEIGDLIGSFKLIKRLGEGGCGIVFLAEQERPLRRRVALKIVKLGMDTRQVIARFEVERQALALMEHPNIARVFDAGATETGRPFFVMEWVDGLPITTYCRKHCLSTRQRLEMFITVCRALQHAHEKGIIHRDIKPSNVLVTVLDGEPVPKVIDFGIAKAVEGRLTEKTLFTEVQQIIGTPAYMSPEQAALSPHAVDTRSDVYALGVLLYELLAGATPFDIGPRDAPLALSIQTRWWSALTLALSPRRGKNAGPRWRKPPASECSRNVGNVLPLPGGEGRGEGEPRFSLNSHSLAEVLRIIREEEPSRPSARVARLKPEVQTLLATQHAQTVPALQRGLRGDLDWIVMKAMEKDRARRYESAAAFARDLERHLSDRPVEARPPGFAYQGQKFVRRHLAAVAAAAVVLFALLGGLAFAMWGLAEARQQSRLAGAAARKAERINELLSEALTQADPTSGQGKDYTVRQLLQDFSEQVNQRSNENPEVEFGLREMLGYVLWRTGDLEKARQHIERGLAMAKDFPEQAHRVASLHFLLGQTLKETGQSVQARDEFGRAAAMRRNLYPGGHYELVRSLAELARAHARLGDSEKAIQTGREALALAQAMESPRWRDHGTIWSWSALVSIYKQSGRFDEMAKAAEEALLVTRRVEGEGNPITLQLSYSLAFSRWRLGHAAQAETILTEILPKQKALLGDQHRQVLESIALLANVTAERGKENQAESLYTELLDGARSTLPENSPVRAEWIEAAGAFYEKAGRAARAAELFAEASRLREQNRWQQTNQPQ